MRFPYIIILVIVALGCSNKSSHKEKMFDKFKNEVSVKVFKDFPINKEFINGSFSQKILFPESFYASKYCGIYIEYSYDDLNYKKTLNEFNEYKLFESDVLDKCNKYVPIIKNNNDCEKKYIPVPKTNDDFIELNIDKSNGKFIVLNYEEGSFINDKYFENGDHGFSNGIIANDNTNKIIYWIIIW